jgi:uncharacterized membrane protein
VAGGVAAVTVVLAALTVPATGNSWVQQLLFWDVYAATYTALSWALFLRRTPAQVEAAALERSRPISGFLRRAFSGRWSTSGLWFAVYGSFYGLAAAGYVLPRAEEIQPEAEGLLTVLGLVAIATSWCAAHTGYVLHYAHLYYGDAGRGLRFHGPEEPNYLDFAYFSFGVGKTFGATDVDVEGRPMRRAVLIHGLYSFAFNSGILAVGLAFITG